MEYLHYIDILSAEIKLAVTFQELALLTFNTYSAVRRRHAGLCMYGLQEGVHQEGAC
jgi:hypothetical protein